MIGGNNNISGQKLFNVLNKEAFYEHSMRK